MGSRTTQKVLAIRQPEEVPISSKRGSVPWLCGVLGRHPYRRRTNRGS